MATPISVHTCAAPPDQPDRETLPHPELTDPVERASSVINRLGRDTTEGDIALADVVDALKDRSFGPILILFAMPNAVVPGVILIVGGPIILIGFQLALGRRKPWLPDFMLKRRFRKATFRAMTRHVGHFLAWIEQWLRPRASWLTSRPVERLLGICIAGLAVLILTPLPFGGALPAVAISLIAAGLAEKDGAAVALGLAIGTASVVYASAFAGGVASAAIALLGG